MSISTKRTLSAAACLCLALSSLTVTTARADTPPPRSDPSAQADEGYQAAQAQLAAQGHAPQGRLTSCTSFSRVNTMTDPVAAKAAADKAIADAQAQSQSQSATGSTARPGGQILTDAAADGSTASASVRKPIAVNPALIVPLPEIPIAEEVTSPVTVTVMPDGGVHVEVSGRGGPGEKSRAVTFEINLAKCSAAFRYATPVEQAQLDADLKQKQQSIGAPEHMVAGPTNPITNWQDNSGSVYHSLIVMSYDPLGIVTSQTMQQLSWGWSNGSIYYVNGWHYCFPYNPTAANTHWYVSWCTANFPQVYYGNTATVSHSAQYWNTDFILCQATPDIHGGTAYAQHYLSLTGYPYGWYNWNVNWYHSGTPCSALLRGTAYFY